GPLASTIGFRFLGCLRFSAQPLTYRLGLLLHVVLCAFFYGSAPWVPPLLVKVMLFFSGLTFQSLLNPLPEPLELLVPSTFVLGFQLSGTALFDFVLLRLLSMVPPRTLARALSGLFTLRPLFLVGSASRFVVL